MAKGWIEKEAGKGMRKEVKNERVGIRLRHYATHCITSIFQELPAAKRRKHMEGDGRGKEGRECME